MKKLSGFLFGLALTGAAAAGVSSSAQAQQYNWGGIYFGASAGWAWSDIDVTGANAGNHFHINNRTYEFENSSWIVGGHVGLQHQFSNWVIGVEASLLGGDFEDSIRAPGVFATDNFSTDIHSIITATARLGYAWDRWLGYIKGGYATARVETRANEVPAFDHFGSSSERHDGWTLGAGLEYAWTSDIIFGVEYNYIDLNSKTHVGSATAAPFVYVADVDPGAINTITARLSIKLGRDAPPPAPLK